MAEPLNATFFGYRKRERGGVLLGAALGLVIVLTVLLGAFGAAAWAVGGEFFTWYGEVMGAAARGDEAQMANVPPPGAIFAIIPLYFLFLFCFFVALAAFEAACLRWMLRGEVSGFMGLTLGADTWRVYGTYWVWLGLFIAFYVAVLVIGSVAGFAVLSADQSGQFGALFVMLIPLVCIIALLVLAVRFAPAAATSVGRGEFSFFKAWTVTSGRFWAMLGAFLLLGLIYILASIVVAAVAFGVLFSQTALAGLDWSTAVSDPQAFSAAYTEAIMSLFASPMAIALYFGVQLVSWAVALFFYIGFYGINARAVEAALEEGKIERAAA
jgi:hypothetical protein